MTIYGIMKVTLGSMSQPGCIICKGERVVVTHATDLPPESGIDYYVARVGNLGHVGNRKGARKSEVTILSAPPAVPKEAIDMISEDVQDMVVERFGDPSGQDLLLEMAGRLAATFAAFNPDFDCDDFKVKCGIA